MPKMPIHMNVNSVTLYVARKVLNEIEPNHAKKCPNLFTCDCGKGYPARNSLWYHKKKCSFVQKDTEEDTKEDTKEDNISLAEKMVEMVMSKNQEFMSEFMGKMMELMPKVGNNTNTNCLNTNNQFNINMFLNEICQRLIETGSAHEDTIVTT
jgi:arginine decarboxylase-like protein